MAFRLIQWPTGNEAFRVMEEFQNCCEFPNVIGAIDGTHIKIRAPSHDPTSYINRKDYHSIILQAVCDRHGKFTHCFAGYPGCTHNARVFRNSPVAQFLQDPEHYFIDNSHIIGDGAYTIYSNVMVPFRDNGHLTVRQRNFNYCLSLTRMAIEKAFGMLKVRFRILLDCVGPIDIKRIPELVIACCVLHNLCLMHNDIMDIVVIENNENENRQELEIDLRSEGNVKRNEIMNRLKILV